ncbi:MAG: glycoside hydrolase domain-containing protein [Pedobacter sp.]|uniref:glycoside hydrolase domain-containing protein n=1 Tax=Pedobacter sp. TaxID=1411316 RepID=UPI00339A9EBB
MKKLLTISLILTSSFSYAQNKDKLTHAIDVDAIRQTELTGDIGLRPTVMSLMARPASVDAYLKKFPAKKYFTFPERRENSIRLLDGLPEKWLSYSAAASGSFTDQAKPGEYFVFQVGVYASGVPLKDIKVKISTLQGSGLQIKDVTCFNTGGISFKGDEFHKALHLGAKKVLPLWFGIQIPENAKGLFRGNVEIKPEGLPVTTITVNLHVSGTVVENRGYNDQNSLSRLAWLNSKIGLDDDITTGYQQLVRNRNNISILGRNIILTATGLPATIDTYFDLNNEKILPEGQPILAKPLEFIVAQGGKPMKFKVGLTQFKDHLPGASSWETKLINADMVITLKGRAEYDGFIGYTALVTPLKNTSVDDIRLEIPMRPEKAVYMMGLDKEGGFSPREDWHWKWDVLEKHQDEVWMGAVNGGLKVKLKGKNYRRQLVNIYYPYGPLKEPESWGNNHKGGVDITKADNAVQIKAYSGQRNLLKGETYEFDFELLITPFKTINKNILFNDRYYHSDIDTSLNFIKVAKEKGADIVVVHHKKDIYPFIDYPFHEENVPDLKAFIDSAHVNGLQTQLYYTTRELTVNAPELWAMRALDNEIIYPGQGMATRTLVNPKGVHPWLGENLKENFIPGWVATFTHGKYKGRQDLAILTTPDSRLNNFFLEGLDWMGKNLKIDGIYMDDLALDRETMKRTRKVLDRERPGAKIDMHTWNHYNKYAKWASSLNLYMDMLPFIDQLWVGEARDYNRSSDYWLIEVSGIPFGLTSQMLNKGGNKWRGMTFGITNRLGWYRSTSPEYLWKFWDEYHIDKKEMIGFWNPSSPVKTDNTDTEVSIYKGKDEVIIAVANWTSKEQKCRLKIDWQALGFSPEEVTAEIPEITEFQEKKSVSLKNELSLESEKGFLIVMRRK